MGEAGFMCMKDKATALLVVHVERAIITFLESSYQVVLPRPSPITKICVWHERGNRTVEDGLSVDLYHLLYSSSATRASSIQFAQVAEGRNMLVC